MRRRRADRTGTELLLLMAFVLAASVAVLVSGEIAGEPAAPIAATVTVEAPSRDLPPEIAELVIEVKELAPLPLRDLVGRVADLAGVRASVQERPGRVLDGDLEMQDPVPFGLSMSETVPAVLDELARLSGYDWGWEDGRLLFYRYADVDQRRPERMPGGVPVEVLAAVAGEELPATDAAEETPAPGAVEDRRGVLPETGGKVDGEGGPEAGRVAASVPEDLEPGGRQLDAGAAQPVEGQEQAAAEGSVPKEPQAWEVNPGTHATVEDVLRSWAARAGWQLAWQSERRFEIGAAAEFPPGETEEEGFLAAADALLAIGPMRRSLTATAYPNRWLVVTDVGSAGQ